MQISPVSNSNALYNAPTGTNKGPKDAEASQQPDTVQLSPAALKHLAAGGKDADGDGDGR